MRARGLECMAVAGTAGRSKEEEADAGQALNAYSYIVARFVPNLIRNEPVNIGAIAVDPDTGRAAGRLLRDLRGLGPRCGPGANLAALEGIAGSMRLTDMPGGVDDLARIANRHVYSLQFTRPRAVLAPSLEDAVRRAYDSYVDGEWREVPRVEAPADAGTVDIP